MKRLLGNIFCIYVLFGHLAALPVSTLEQKTANTTTTRPDYETSRFEPCDSPFSALPPANQVDVLDACEDLVSSYSAKHAGKTTNLFDLTKHVGRITFISNLKLDSRRLECRYVKLDPKTGVCGTSPPKVLFT